MCSLEIGNIGYSIPYSVPWIGSNRKSRPNISWNTEYNATNNCTNPRMSFSHQSVRVLDEVIKIFIYIFDEKCERKKKDSLRNEIRLCHTFHRKEGVELMYWLDPSGLTGLEPAASALTGRCSDQLNYNPREMKGYIRKLDSFLFPCIRYFWRVRGYTISWEIGEFLGRAGFEPA